MQLKLNDIYRVRDILCCGRSERRLSFTSGNVRRDGQGTMEEDQKKKDMKTLTESSGQLTAHGHGGTILPRSNVRTDIQQKAEVSSTADRSPSASGRASAMLGRTSPMRWDDISPHKGYMK